MRVKFTQIAQTKERLNPLTDAKDVAILRSHIARYNFAMKFCEGKTVADMACGTGYGMSLISYVSTLIDGYDNSPEALSVAEEMPYFSPYRLFPADLNIDNLIHPYDVILSFETLEHLFHVEHFVEQAANTCRTFIFSTPNEIFDHDNHYHVRRFNKLSLEILIKTYFKGGVQWFGQEDGTNFITPLNANKAKYLYGIARN